jgi:replicative DNA helicase
MALHKATVEAEQAVLAVLLNDSHAVIHVMEVVQPSDFGDPLRAAIYATVLECVKAGVVPNIHTVGARLLSVDIDTLKAISGHFNTKVNREVIYIADEVKTAATVRRVQEAVGHISTEADKAPRDLDGFVQFSVEILTGAIEGHANQDASIGAALAELDATIQRAACGVRGITTGSRWLDGKTGGLMPATVWMIAAAYKQRKTTLMRNMVIAACKAKASVDVFALEGDRQGTTAGLIAMLATDLLYQADCDPAEMVLSETWIATARSTATQKAAIDAAWAELATWNLRIYDAKHGVCNPAKLALKVKRDKFMYGVQVFFVDYLQRLSGAGTLYERVESGTRQLQDLIGQEGITGVILAQLNEETVRQSDDSESYSPGVKGGGDPAAAADYLLRTKYDANSPDELTVQLKLARHAQPGSCKYAINRQSGLIINELGSRP